MAIKSPFKSKLTLQKVYPYLLVVAGIIGLICSFVIMYDKLKILQNPNYHPSCSINPVVSCGSVMSSHQGSAFGFPNPIIGLVGFGIIITVGMALLAGAQFKKWFWLGLQAGTIFGLLFIHWLFFESVYRINALCPYCIVVWIVTIAIFLYTLLMNCRLGHLPKVKALTMVINFVQKHHVDILISWYLIIAGLILNHFWYFFGPK